MKTLNFYICAAVVMLAVTRAHADDGWQVQVGGAYQWGMKMDTRGPALTTPHNYSIPPGVLPPDDGSVLAGTDGYTFMDGYVRRDWYMDAPGASGNNLTMTWNWYYENASQYNAIDHTLAFHRETAVSAGGTDDKTFDAAGLEISARHQLLQFCGLDLGVDLAADWFPSMQASQTRFASSLFQTFYFSDPWGVLPGLAPGYQGPDYNYNNPATPGDAGNLNLWPIQYAPTIGNTLEQTRVTTQAELYRVRTAAGPTLSVPLTDKLSVYATPQFTLSLVHADVTRHSTTTSTDMGTGITTLLSSSDASDSKTAVLGGFLLAAGVDYQFAQDWYVGANIGHEWIPDGLSVNVGPDKTRLNLGGGQASIYVGTKF